MGRWARSSRAATTSCNRRRNPHPLNLQQEGQPRRLPLFLRAESCTFLEYKLTLVFVSSFKDAGTEGEVPLEEVTFAVGQVQITYVPTLANGKPGTPVKSGWNFVENKEA